MYLVGEFLWNVSGGVTNKTCTIADKDADDRRMLI